MFALPGLILLVITIYARPHEFVEQFVGLPVLYYLLALTVFGLVLDVRLRFAALRASAHTWLVIAFWGWCVLTLAVRAPAEITKRTLTLTVAVALFLVIAHGVQSIKSFQVLSAVLLGIGLFVTAVCVHQGFSDFGCVRYAEGGDRSLGKPDGRPCEEARECYEGEAEPGQQYVCEKVGLLGTTSISHGRVRYLGVLQDPNEVALTTGLVVPLAFGFRERRPTIARTALLVFTLLLALLCTILTQSRGGQLVFCAIVAAYFVRKYGARGLLIGAVLALPLVLLGGRGGEEASQSTEERFECWYNGMTMLAQYPIFGVGMGRFTEHHYLTAHSAFVLSAAELGIPGATLFTALLYLSFKVPIVALRRYVNSPEAAAVRTWAMALLALLCGMVVGIALLSFTYHFVLWIHFGLVGAFYMAVRRHDPDFDVRLGLRDAAQIVAIEGVLLAALFAYTRLKGLGGHTG